jgi:hypothetical protein
LAASRQDHDYVLTDVEGAMLAVVRPLRDRPRGGVPDWGFYESECLLVVERDGVAGLAVTSMVEPQHGQQMSVRRKQVWAGSGVLLGTITYPSPEDAVASFSGATGVRRDVRRRRKPNPEWWVTEATGADIARVTPRRAVLPGSAGETEGRLAGWVAAGKRARWGPPEGCEIVEAGPTFDWVRHGLLVVAAAVCDREVRHRARPPQPPGD